MALVHMKARDFIVSEDAQHSHTANAKDNLLAQTITLISSVEVMCQRSVVFGIFGEIAVEEIYRSPEISRAFDFVPPAPQVNVSSFDGDCGSLGNFRQKAPDLPVFRFLALPPAGVQMLVEIPFSVEQRHPYHRNPEIRRRPNGISRQNPEAPAIGRHPHLKGKLHREISDDLRSVQAPPPKL